MLASSVRCRMCDQETSSEDVVFNGYNLPFHTTCFPPVCAQGSKLIDQNRQRASDGQLSTRPPLSTINSKPDVLRCRSSIDLNASQQTGRASRCSRDSRMSQVLTEEDKEASVKLQQFVLLPENNVCGDCGLAQPRWASTTIGVFLCTQCSGEHRSLGSHVCSSDD